MIKYLAPAMAIACAAAAPSAAKDVSFNFSSGGSTVASGSFSFANGSTGVLGYNDLSAFSVSIAYSGNTYTLGDVLPLTDYVHFAYDTSTNSLIANPNTCGFSGCGFNSIMSAVNSSANYGFFFNPPPGAFADYQNFAATPYDTLRLSVPEPETWALLMIGFFAVGSAVRKRTRAKVSFAQA